MFSLSSLFNSSFDLLVTNDNRSDTFPETPFHIKVLASNDQAPVFKETVSTVGVAHGGSTTLGRDLFDVIDPDTSIDNLVFMVEKAPENCVLELRARGQRHVLNKEDSFTMHEIRDGIFRIINSGGSLDKDILKISVFDGKHVAVKTIGIEVNLLDKTAPRATNRTTMLVSLREGQTKTIRRESLAFADDKSSPQEIVFRITKAKKGDARIAGKLMLRDKLLVPQMTFTQADVDLQNLK